MNNKQKFQTLLNIGLYSSLLFFILSGLSMYFYPGGTMHNNPANPLYDSIIKPYSHTMNFFSDLGLHSSWAEFPNSVSSILFSYSLFFVSIGIISFYSAIHFILKKDKNLILLSKISILISVLSAIGFIFVGFTPADILGKAHMFAVNLAFRSFLVVMFFYSYMIFRSNYLKNYLSFIYIILFCLVGYYVYIIIAGPPLPLVPYGHADFASQIPNESDLWFHVVSQKFVVYGLSFSILWQLLELRKQKYVNLID